MRRSIDRILVSHAGNLPRPDDLNRLLAAGESERVALSKLQAHCHLGLGTLYSTTAQLDTGQVTRLYAIFPSISRLRPAEQQRLLEELGRIADNAFRGRVERHMVTPLYTAQRR